MRRRGIALAVGIASCGGQEPAPIPVTLAVEDPWALVSQDADEIAVRYGQTGEGVRIWLRPTAEGPAGVSPVHDGRTFEVRDEGVAWPLVAWAYPDRVERVEVRVQGIDLVVRAYGPTLHAVTGRDDAPDDPVITWVRLRPRPQDWRVVVDGLGTVSLPAPSGPVTASQGGWTWTLDGPAGAVALDTNAPRWTSRLTPARWAFDVTPSIEVQQPYPRTALTWAPVSPSPPRP